jgi:type VI secretion system protein ImpI
VNTAYILRAYLFDGTLVKEQRFGSLPVRVGRNTLNDFQVPQARVSSFHAVLEPINGRVCVRDLGSMNGILVRDPGTLSSIRISPNAPIDLASYGSEFFLGPQVQVSLQTVQLDQPLSSREGSPSDGAVLGNAQMLMAPGFQPVQPYASFPHEPPPVVPPRPTSAPPPAGSPQLPSGVPQGAGYGYGYPPQGYGAGPPATGHVRGGLPPQGPAVSRGGEVPKETGYFSSFSLEALALQGLHELASSLVPEHQLQTSGDVARFITKLHDSLDVFCRCFIPLREGHAQFVSSLDLQRAAGMRSFNRSPAYMAVETARDPDALARGLLDWTEKSLDGHKAIEGIYADLMIHQVALLEGVMQGVRALLQELSPENIEQTGNPARFGLSNRYKELWQSYCERYADLAEEQQAFSRIFGQEFTQAYREYQQRRRSGETT